MNWLTSIFGSGNKPAEPKEFDAMSARRLTEKTYKPTKDEEAAKYMANCMTEVKRVASSGHNMAFFNASSFKHYGGIEYFETRGYRVYLVDGGTYDRDDYRVEW